MANYSQAIEENKISSIITFCEEFLFAVVGALILTRVIGGVGIWVSIIVAECVPVFIYIIYAVKVKNQSKDRVNRLLMIQNSKLVTWTYNRQAIGNVDKYLDDKSRDTVIQIEKCLKDNAALVTYSIDDVCIDIFKKTDIDDVDITIRLTDEKLYIVFTSAGRLYNPFSNEKLMKSDRMKKLSNFNCKFDYDEILGFNKSYLILDR